MYEKMKDIIKVINNESPIRKQIDISNEFEETYNEDAKRLKEIEENLEVIYNKINNTLKVVLMGEVKAGKSTIINSIVGEEISYVNVVEATASIIEIEYGFNENAAIKKKNKEEYLVQFLEPYSIEKLKESKISNLVIALENLCKRIYG